MLENKYPPLQIKNFMQSSPDEYTSMHGSEGRGIPLVKSGEFAADYLKFLSGQKTSLHTHVGNHILIIVTGNGWLDYGNECHTLISGDCYFVPGEVPHRIRASADGLRLYSIADQHQSVDSHRRLRIISE